MADNVATMHVGTCITRGGGNTYTRHLHREDYRDGKKGKRQIVVALRRMPVNGRLPMEPASWERVTGCLGHGA